ncbi:MAG: DUF2470 domain-containing protein [Alphaproteobacteria bacterium]|nr:DUF2470 domain-containing protein [Alphaproteobacteria bacterium]
MRGAERAALSTGLGDRDGWPYGSLVLTASDVDGAPILLMSALAVHTINIKTDDRVSLLFDGTAGFDDPLAGPRVTVLGRAIVSDLPHHRARFLARHPGAREYADFGDFAFYRVDPVRAHSVAGFGHIHWLSEEDLAFDVAGCGNLIDAEAEIVDHMNADHSDAIGLYAMELLGRDGSGWIMTGIDPEGCDLRCGGNVARLNFEEPIFGPDDARRALAALAARARESRDSAPIPD